MLFYLVLNECDAIKKYQESNWDLIKAYKVERLTLFKRSVDL